MRKLATAIAAAAVPFIMACFTPLQAQGRPSGVHDFNFELGDWLVHHRIKSAGDDPQWLEFDGTCSTRSLMEDAMNVEEHKFDKPGGVTRGVALRAYDAKTAQWAIWWVDSRNPHGALDPPVVGHFEHGVGTFYSDSLVDGKTIRTRFVWSQITATSAHWEQAYSSDSGKTWVTNWIMDFRRVNPK